MGKPGRKPKVLKTGQLTTNALLSEAKNGLLNTPKRGRGRPRKYENAGQTPSSKESNSTLSSPLAGNAEPPPKRKRGRPRTTPITTPIKVAEEVDEGPTARLSLQVQKAPEQATPIVGLAPGEVPIVRKRGRPPKNPSPFNSPSKPAESPVKEEPDQETPVKRVSGRFQSNVATGEEQQAAKKLKKYQRLFKSGSGSPSTSDQQRPPGPRRSLRLDPEASKTEPTIEVVEQKVTLPTIIIEAPSDNQPKRRGRKRKHPLPESLVSPKSEDAASTLLNSSTNISEIQSPAPVTPKRGRGRPRSLKSPISTPILTTAPPTSDIAPLDIVVSKQEEDVVPSVPIPISSLATIKEEPIIAVEVQPEIANQFENLSHVEPNIAIESEILNQANIVTKSEELNQDEPNIITESEAANESEELRKDESNIAAEPEAVNEFEVLNQAIIAAEPEVLNQAIITAESEVANEFEELRKDEPNIAVKSEASNEELSGAESAIMMKPVIAENEPNAIELELEQSVFEEIAEPRQVEEVSNMDVIEDPDHSSEKFEGPSQSVEAVEKLEQNPELIEDPNPLTIEDSCRSPEMIEAQTPLTVEYSCRSPEMIEDQFPLAIEDLTPTTTEVLVKDQVPSTEIATVQTLTPNLIEFLAKDQVPSMEIAIVETLPTIALESPAKILIPSIVMEQTTSTNIPTIPALPKNFLEDPNEEENPDEDILNEDQTPSTVTEQAPTAEHATTPFFPKNFLEHSIKEEIQSDDDSKSEIAYKDENVEQVDESSDAQYSTNNQSGSLSNSTNIAPDQQQNTLSEPLEEPTKFRNDDSAQSTELSEHHQNQQDIVVQEKPKRRKNSFIKFSTVPFQAKEIGKFAQELAEHLAQQSGTKRRSSKMSIVRQAVHKKVEQKRINVQETRSSIKLVPKGRGNVSKVRVETTLTIVKQEEPEIKVPVPVETVEQNVVPTPKVLPPIRRPRYREIDDCVICCDIDLVTHNERAHKCKCKAANHNCSQDCLNRAMHYECPKKCDNGDMCKNRRFQNREYAKLECFDTQLKGRGVRALEAIPKGTFLIEYLGEIIDHRKFNKRSKRYAHDPEHTHHYVMSLNAHTYIDATKRGNMARFVNHSCEPNAATEKWTVERRDRIGFFAIRDIEAGEEIVFDYKFERFGDTAQKCHCGSVNCRGIIGSESTLPREPVIDDSDEEDSSDSSEESSDDETENQLDPQSPAKVVKTAEVAVENEMPKQRPSSELNEKWQKVGFKDYKIPKKAPKVMVNSKLIKISSELKRSAAKASNESIALKRRKSRFEPASEQVPQENQPSLVQLPTQTSNSSCSNTCSSSSTPTQQQCTTPILDAPSVTQATQPPPRRKSRFEATSKQLEMPPTLIQIPSSTPSCPNVSIPYPSPMFIPPPICFPPVPMMSIPPLASAQYFMSMPPPPNGMMFPPMPSPMLHELLTIPPPPPNQN